MGRRTVGWVALAIALVVAGACGGGEGGGASSASACILTDEEMADAMGGTFRVTRSGTTEAGLGMQCTYAGSYTVRGETSGRTGTIVVTVISERSRGVDSMTAMRKNGEPLDGIGDEAATDDLFAMNRILMRLDDGYYLVGFRNETGSNPKATTKRIAQAIEEKLGSA